MIASAVADDPLKDGFDRERDGVANGRAERGSDFQLFACDADQVNIFRAIAGEFGDEDGFGDAG